jgi:hypothetical protein
MTTREPSRPPKPPRKPYRRPVLENFGNIRTLTKIAGGTMGLNDQAIMGNKTGL